MGREWIAPGPGERLDRLADGWRIFQLRRGHRFNTDDVLTAWTAVNSVPSARRILDLGAGVGSIGLLTLRQLSQDARLVSVEVQPVSVSLMRKTIAYNGLCGRVEPRLVDLHARELLSGGEPLVVRGADGRWTREYLEIREKLAIDVQ